VFTTQTGYAIFISRDGERAEQREAIRHETGHDSSAGPFFNPTQKKSKRCDSKMLKNGAYVYVAMVDGSMLDGVVKNLNKTSFDLVEAEETKTVVLCDTAKIEISEE
jgi:hypothetical protein